MPRLVAYGDAIATGIAKVNPQILNLGGPGRGFIANNLAASAPIQRGDQVIVSIGWCDVAGLFSSQPLLPISAYERRYIARLHELHTRNGGANIVMLGLEPLQRSYPGLSNTMLLPMNQLLERIARRAEVHFLDLASQAIGQRAADGMLYQPGGYQLILARAGHVGDMLHLPLGLGHSTYHTLG